MTSEDRRERLRRFYAAHRDCAALRAYIASDDDVVQVRLKCVGLDGCDARTLLTVKTSDVPTWLIDDTGTLCARPGKGRFQNGRRYSVVMGAATAEDAREWWSRGEVCAAGRVWFT